LAVLAFAVLTLRVWRLQVVEGSRYTAWADRIRLRQIALPAPRGVIYDRRGEILVRNVPSFSIAVVPADLPDDREQERAMIRRLVDLFQITDETWLQPPFMAGDNAEVGAEQWEAHALAASVRGRSDMLEPVAWIEAQINRVRDLAPYQPLVIKTNVGR
jgi:cell division protein FtsI/penicillin-binding protein 2